MLNEDYEDIRCLYSDDSTLRDCKYTLDQSLHSKRWSKN